MGDGWTGAEPPGTDGPRSSMTTARMRCAKGVVSVLALIGCVAADDPQAPVYGPTAPADVAAAADVVPLSRPPAISPELANATERAIDSYPSIRAGKASIRAAQADIRGAKWLQYPSVSLEGLAFTGGRASTLGDRNLTTNLVVDQPIWAGGRIASTIRRAQALKLVSQAQLLETVENIELRMIEAYFGMARAARQAAVLTEGLDEHRKLVESIGRRVDQEISPRADLDLARSRTSQLEQDLAGVSAQRYASLQQFRELVGDPNYDPGNVPLYDAAIHHPDPTRALEQAVTCSPRRQRLSAEALVARADVKIAEAAIFPQLSAQYSRNEVTGDRVGLALRAQTNGGLSNVSAIDGAKLRRDAADLQTSVAERELRETVTLDLVENISARDRIASAGNASASARTVTESYKRQFVAGRRTWLDVMNAVREASSSELSQAEGEVGAMASSARILLRTCRWQPDFSEGSGQ